MEIKESQRLFQQSIKHFASQSRRSHRESGEETVAGDGSQQPAAMDGALGGSAAVSLLLTYVLGASSGPPELSSRVPRVSTKVSVSHRSTCVWWPSQQQGDCIGCLVKLGLLWSD